MPWARPIDQVGHVTGSPGAPPGPGLEQLPQLSLHDDKAAL